MSDKPQNNAMANADPKPSGSQDWATRAALATCPDRGKPTPEGSVHTCSPQKPDSWDAVIDNMMGEQNG